MEEYWSEEPNHHREMGITYQRATDLMELHTTVDNEEMKKMGWVTFAAYHDPKSLKDIGKKTGGGTNVDLDNLPSMLKATS